MTVAIRFLIDTNHDNDLTDPTDVVILWDALQGGTNTDSSSNSLASGIYLTEYAGSNETGADKAKFP